MKVHDVQNCMEDVFRDLDGIGLPFKHLIDELDGKVNGDSQFAMFVTATVHYYRSGRVEKEVTLSIISDLFPSSGRTHHIETTNGRELLLDFYFEILPAVIQAIQKRDEEEKDIGAE